MHGTTNPKFIQTIILSISLLATWPVVSEM